MSSIASQTMPVSPRLPDATRLGVVHLTVRDLDRSLDFYRNTLGLAELDRRDRFAAVGSSGPLLELHEEPGASTPTGTAGLYHVALNYPERIELSRAARRLAHSRAPIQGASDHRTHEAIYLADPDGNGLELAADRPGEAWPDLSNVENLRPAPLDFDDLLSLSAREPLSERAQAGMRVGHMHLHLGDLDEGQAFYSDLIGFDTMTIIPGQAVFVSAGGYHHHLGFNLWRGRGIPPQRPGVVGLRHWTIVVPDPDDVAAVQARLEAAGRTAAAVTGGFRTQDPGGLHVHVVSSEGQI